MEKIGNFESFINFCSSILAIHAAHCQGCTPSKFSIIYVWCIVQLLLMCDLLGIQKLPTVQNMEMQVSITIYVCPNNTVKTKS